MSAHPIIHIASVNMRKRNAVTHALLNSNNNAHLMLIQEPWFDKIGTARKDNARQGIDVLGGVAAPKWELIYPGHTEKQVPKVMAYVRKPTTNSPHFNVVPRLDICSHPTLQVLDVVFDDEETWRVINFYHDIRDDTSLQALLSLDIDALTPTLIIGDFNTHAQTWSLPDTPRSQWAPRIEEWAALNLLTLANTQGEVTRRGAEHERDSVIDLAWYNEAAIQFTTFSDLKIDWEGSLGSDHAMLLISGQTQGDEAALDHGGDLGFLIDPDRGEDWTRAFKA
jgi:Endonuclease-reverse transcriptase